MVYIIAEIGFNHLGNLELAKEMIDAASDSGASCAKFQSWKVQNLKDGPWNTDGRREIYQKSELSKDAHVELINHCNKKGIDFLTSVFDLNTMEDLANIGLRSIKIASTDCHDVMLLKKANSIFDSVIVSTGAATKDEIKNIIEVIDEDKLTLLHCVSMYPCPAEKVALKSMLDLRELGAKKIGYSGHYDGIEDAVLALALGASVIEKHFTTDKSLPGRDNKFALNPAEMRKLVDVSHEMNKMNVKRDENFTEGEKEVRLHYRGRFSGN